MSEAKKPVLVSDLDVEMEQLRTAAKDAGREAHELRATAAYLRDEIMGRERTIKNHEDHIKRLQNAVQFHQSEADRCRLEANSAKASLSRVQRNMLTSGKVT